MSSGWRWFLAVGAAVIALALTVPTQGIGQCLDPTNEHPTAGGCSSWETTFYGVRLPDWWGFWTAVLLALIVGTLVWTATRPRRR